MSDFEIILNHLNKKAHRKFRLGKETTKILTKILKEFSVDDCLLVIDAKCHQWVDCPKMSKHLKPSVLFRYSNFNRYYEEDLADYEDGLSILQCALKELDDCSNKGIARYFNE